MTGVLVPAGRDKRGLMKLSTRDLCYKCEIYALRDSRAFGALGVSCIGTVRDTFKRNRGELEVDLKYCG